MAATGCAIEGAICTCVPAQNRRERPQVLPAYGLQDLRNKHQDPKTKSNPNTMHLQTTLGEDHGSGHFYLAKTRTFSFCGDTNGNDSGCESNPSMSRRFCFSLWALTSSFSEPPAVPSPRMPGPLNLRMLLQFIPETARRISATILRMVILGINAYHANASAAILADGRLLAAVEEERLNRVKYAAGLPARAIQYCLDQAGVRLSEVDHIAIPRDPWARLPTKLRFAMRMPKFALDRARVMRRFAGVKEDLATAFDMPTENIRAQFHRIEHHTAHLASAYFVSPFENSAVLSADGLGDFASSMWAQGEGPRMRPLGEITFPHSLGMYYTALTQYIGFWKFGDEYKVMGLAAYGEPEFLDEFRRIVYADGPLSFRLGLEYFTHQRQGADMTWREANQTPVLGRLFSSYLEKRLGPARKDGEPLEQRHHNIAASMQAALEEVLGAHWSALAEKTKQKSLCLAGGVAFNCLANGKIFDRSPFERVYVQPAAGDAGLSVGAAFAVNHQVLGRPRE